VRRRVEVVFNQLEDGCDNCWSWKQQMTRRVVIWDGTDETVSNGLSIHATGLVRHPCKTSFRCFLGLREDKLGWLT
jgi:hypothetical protein